MLCLPVGHTARFAVLDSGAKGEVCCVSQCRTWTLPYSTQLPNLKHNIRCIKILKEFKICRQTDRQTDLCLDTAQIPLPTSKHYLPRPLRGVADKKKLRIMLHSRQQLQKRENGGTLERCKNLFYSWSLMMMMKKVVSKNLLIVFCNCVIPLKPNIFAISINSLRRNMVFDAQV